MYYDMMEGGGASLAALLIFAGIIGLAWWRDKVNHERLYGHKEDAGLDGSKTILH